LETTRHDVAFALSISAAASKTDDALVHHERRLVLHVAQAQAQEGIDPGAALELPDLVDPSAQGVCLGSDVALELLVFQERPEDPPLEHDENAVLGCRGHETGREGREEGLVPEEVAGDKGVDERRLAGELDYPRTDDEHRLSAILIQRHNLSGEEVLQIRPRHRDSF
jgi:hypothetical protein